MAVAVALPKSEPDLSKIQGFTALTVMVSRYLHPRQTGTTVLPPTSMQYEQFLDLYTKLPLQFGPGYYKFSVTESGGTGEDIFMTRLGPEQPEDGAMMATGLPISGANGTTNPGQVSEGVRQLGHGYMYDEKLGLLTTPWRQIVAWTEGQPLPSPPSTAAVGAATQYGPATPVPGSGGWGVWPVNDGSSDRERRLEASLAEEKRQREMDKLHEEIRRVQDENTKQIAALIAKIGEKPSGPSESELALRREMEETKRQAAETARRAEERERDEQRRREDERRDEQRRQELREMREQNEKALREIAGSNKQDSMLAMVTTLMTTMQTSAAEQMKAIQAMMGGLAQASERGALEIARRMETMIMNPMQLVQIMNSAKGDGAEAARIILGSVRDSMELQKNTYEMLLEASQAPQQPAWLTAVEKVADKATAIGAAYAERAAQQQQQQQPPQQVQRVVYQAPPMARPAQGTVAALPNGTPVVLPPAPVAARPGAVDTGGRPEGSKYDPSNDTWLLRDGSRIRNTDAQRIGWKAVFAEPQTYVFPAGVVVPPPASTAEIPVGAAPVSAPATPVELGAGTTLGAPAQPIAPPQLSIVPPPAKKPKRPRGKKDQPIDVTKLTLAQLTEMEPEKVFELFSAFSDDVVFGPQIWPYVQQLRAAVASKDPSMTPDKIAEMIMQARQYVKDGAIKPTPMVIDLVDALQLDVLAARLMPELPPAAVDAVAEAIETRLRAAGVEFPPDDDDEEEDEPETTA